MISWEKSALFFLLLYFVLRETGTWIHGSYSRSQWWCSCRPYTTSKRIHRCMICNILGKHYARSFAADPYQLCFRPHKGRLWESGYKERRQIPIWKYCFQSADGEQVTSAKWQQMKNIAKTFAGNVEKYLLSIGVEQQDINDIRRIMLTK